MKKLAIVSLLSLIGLATTCTAEFEGAENAAPLSLQVNVDNTSRAAITSDNMPTSSIIGIALVDKSGTTYDANDYYNVSATTTDGVVWTPSGSVLTTKADESF